MDSLTGAIAGARFRFQTDAPELAAYARLHLARTLGREDGPDVDVLLRWHEAIPPRARGDLDSLERVDRDLYVGHGEVRWFRVDDLRDLWLSFAWDGRRLRVEGDFHFHVGDTARSDLLRRWLSPARAASRRQRRFTTLLYYLVYYPCWWWLEHVRDTHPIHAAAVVTDQGTVLLAGGSGIGKSTLSALLGLQSGARLLSDSFVMHNGVDVEPVREPLLLDVSSRRWLGQPGDALEPIARSYVLGREGFHFPTERLAERGRVSVLLFPRRASRPRLQRLSAEQAAALLSAGNLIVNDLRRYWAFAAVLEYVSPDGLMARREDHLRRLTAEVPCLELAADLRQSPGEILALVAQAQKG